MRGMLGDGRARSSYRAAVVAEHTTMPDAVASF